VTELIVKHITSHHSTHIHNISIKLQLTSIIPSHCGQTAISTSSLSHCYYRTTGTQVL